MSKCDLCGQEAGMLRKRHKECEAQHEAGKSETAALVTQSALTATDPQTLLDQLAEIGNRSYLTRANQTPYLVTGWQQAVDLALNDDLLTTEEERSLIALANALSLSQETLEQNGAWSRLVKAAVLRDILEGTLPQRLSFVDEPPFVLQKGEAIVWAFTNVTCYEQRVYIHYEGGSHGVSVRVAKGLYYRVGSFRGQPVSTTQMATVGVGTLGITDKHIYFAAPAKAFRIPYSKIVSFTPYSDGIGVQRDAQTAKPQAFVTGDGWFTYNLVTNQARQQVPCKGASTPWRKCARCLESRLLPGLAFNTRLKPRLRFMKH